MMVWNRLAQPLISYARRGISRPPRSNGRIIQSTLKRFNSSNPRDTGQYAPDPTDQNDAEGDSSQGRKNNSDPNFKSTILKMLETAATTAASIAILG